MEGSVINKDDLGRAAEILKKELDIERRLPPSLELIRVSLQCLIGKVIRMEIDSPVDENTIPGAYQFNEGVMRDFPELEEAYVEFRIQASGGLSEKQKALLDNMRKR